jgi:hypothetical protein
MSTFTYSQIELSHGEGVTVNSDLSQGTSQEYVEDCPICCRANVITSKSTTMEMPEFGLNLNRAR